MAIDRVRIEEYDERVYRRGHPPHRIRTALIAIAVLLAGGYLAVAKELPFGSEYELKAVFENAANIRDRSPVRIAGVDVGEVKSVRSVGEAAEVTFTVSDDGRPVHEDAGVRIRPRIFLEGNFFLDLSPGSPSAAELPDGGTIPVSRTSTAVQLDELLTALQAPDRRNLVELLEGYGGGLNRIPAAAEDRDQDRAVRGESAAQAINDSFRYGGRAARDTALVTDALLGSEPADLSRLLASQSEVFAALLAREQQLQDLITNFDTTAGALARESANLGATVRQLAPTLETARPSLVHLNAMLPVLRAFARDIEPGVRQIPATIRASGPWLRQARRLLGRRELGHTARQLRLAAPGLAAFSDAGQGLFRGIELASRCADELLVPSGDQVIENSGPYALSTGSPNYKELLYAAVNFAGAGQTFDGNGPFLRLQGGGGPQDVRAPVPNAPLFQTELFGSSIEPQLGTRPSLQASARPPFRTDVACHLNALPDLNGPAAAIGPSTPEAIP
jgi:ABC-type transporter Mla subunit MlaD